MSLKTPEQKNTEEIINLFQPAEGDVCFYYGGIRQGKSYAATSDILQLLKRGEIVYANWQINWDGFDERKHFWVVLTKTLFGKKYFFDYKKENFHYIPPEEVDVAFLGRLVGVHIFIDEGQWIFNSHLRQTKNEDLEHRKLILHNGHYCRSLNIISQRPMNIIKDMRSQINVWYKCEKVRQWPWIQFKRTSFQEMKNDMPDEELPAGRPKYYFGRKRVFEAYDTHAMRSENAIEEQSIFEVYKLKSYEKIYLVLWNLILRFLRRKKKEPVPKAGIM